MADATLLLTYLSAYRDSLRKHVTALQGDFDVLERRWRAFAIVYEGNAAKQFKNGWFRTENNFEVYIEQTHRILDVLDERIRRLAEVDRTEDML